MAKYLVLALTNPLPGRESEFNSWYDNVALPVYESLPGVTCLGRYTSVAHDGYEFEMREPHFDYLSLYEIDTEDATATFTEIRRALDAATKDGRYHFSEAIDKARFFEPVFIRI
ncbi:hypothetical protein ACVH9Z_25485 [Rhodococcus opacus]